MVQQISPFTQYYLRKLLHQHVNRLAVINPVFNGLHPEHCETSLLEGSSQRELEMLIQHCQRLETHITHEYETLADVKRRIFRLLGVRLNPLSPSPIPTTIQEQGVSLFRFYQTGNLREGMKYEGELYGLVHRFNIVHRLPAYQLAWALTEQGIPFILTTSESRYGIWISLRSPTYSVVVSQGAAALDKVMSLYAVMHSLKTSA
jgi:hypothetical protein